MDKEKIYQELMPQVAALIAGETDEVGVQANIAAVLKERLGYFWIGFYTHRDGDKLRLGPFQGSVACYTIPYGKGVCGAAWARGETIVVPDVEAFPGHIACSSLSRSEIVVPVFDGQGKFRCVLDIDSDELNAFDETDKKYLEQLARLMTENLYAKG